MSGAWNGRQGKLLLNSMPVFICSRAANSLASALRRSRIRLFQTAQRVLLMFAGLAASLHHSSSASLGASTHRRWSRPSSTGPATQLVCQRDTYCSRNFMEFAAGGRDR